MTLEELIRASAASGALNHLSLIPRGEGSKRGPTIWSATYTAAPSGQNNAEHSDPVEAIRAAIEGFKRPRKARRFDPVDKPESEIDSDFG